MSEPDFIMKIETQLELVSCLHNLAVKYKDTFHGVVTSVSSETKIASVDAMEKGNQLHYLLIANSEANTLAFRTCLRDKFTADNYLISTAAILNHVKLAELEQKEKQQPQDIETKRFRTTTIIAIIGIVVASIIGIIAIIIAL